MSLLLTDPYNNQVLNLNSAQDGGPLTLTAGGTYNLLVVGASSSPVNYQFRLTDTLTVPLAFGTTVNGTLSPASAAAVYTFVGMSGERVDFHGLSESNGYSGASWRLIGPNNQLITTSPFGADLTATLPIVGTYTLVLSNANSSPPTYSFEAFQSVNPSTSLTLGQEVTGNLTNPGDEATYTFTGAPGQRVGFNRIGSNSKLSLQLTDPFGGLVFSQGTNLGIAGPYTLAWAGPTPSPSPGPDRTTSSWTTPRWRHHRAGHRHGHDHVRHAGHRPLDPALSVQRLGRRGRLLPGAAGLLLARLSRRTLRPDRRLPHGLLPRAARAQVTLPSTGTYLLAVAGQGTVAGAVTYRFEAFENVDPSATLRLGQEVTGSITNPGDEATYTFQEPPASVSTSTDSTRPASPFSSPTPSAVPSSRSLCPSAMRDPRPYTRRGPTP